MTGVQTCALPISGADRRRSAAGALDRGATALVLDDGFQHRRARRDADVVLLSADRHRQVRLLPAGPWREPAMSLRRATHVIVTRKRAMPLHAREVMEYVTRVAPNAVPAIVHLTPEFLVRWETGERHQLEDLAGRTALAISAIGDPRAFESQLRAAAMRVALLFAPSGDGNNPAPAGQPVSISSDLPSGVTNRVPPPPSTSMDTTFKVPSAAKDGMVRADASRAAANILRIMLFHLSFFWVPFPRAKCALAGDASAGRFQRPV